MKTAELQGAALDLAVAKAEGATDFWYDTVATYWVKLDGKDRALRYGWAQSYLPSTDWAQGGPIIEREGIDLIYERNSDGHIVQIWARIGEDAPPEYFGQTGLIAAMRCYVASKMGDTVDIPKELT
jgi:hypothetical protein